MNDLIKIDSLPSKHGSIYECLQGGLFSCIVAGVLNQIAERFNVQFLVWLAAALLVFSGFCWFTFYNRFSKSCRKLKHGEANISKIIAYTCLIGSICGAICWIANRPDSITYIAIYSAGFAGLVIFIANIIFTVKFGLVLKKHYAGTLGEVGQSIIYSVIMIMGLVLFCIAGVALSIISLDVLSIITFIIFAFSIFWLIYTYTSVWDRMVDIVETGFFEYEESK